MIRAVALLVATTLFTGSPRDRAQASTASPQFDVVFVESDRRVLAADERATIRAVVDAAAPSLGEWLPGLPDRIEVEVVSGTQVIPGFGSGAMAQAPGKIQWTVDPEFEGGPIAVARAELHAALFHESHHLARGWTVQGGTAGTRMIDAAVAEGMATAFERDAGGGNPPWGDYPADDVGRWVEELVAVEGGLRDYQMWMFYHPDGRQWIGYRAGTYVADRAMEACGCTAADLVETPTDRILEMARGARGPRQPSSVVLAS